MKSRKKSLFGQLTLFISLTLLSSNISSAFAAPAYPPTVGGCSKSTFSDLVINTPNVTVTKIKLENNNLKVVNTKVNRANTFLLSGISVGKIANIKLILPSKKSVELKSSVISTGGLICPTNVTFKKVGNYQFNFKIGSVSRSILFKVSR